MTEINSTTQTNIRAIDMFCGIGGNSWGAKEAGVEIVAGFDKWELAGEVYKDNFPDANFYPYRLQDVNLKKIKNELGQIDLILASPECTSHSVARGNKPTSEESLFLSYQVLRFAKELNPRWVVIENVSAMKNWSGYKEFLKELRKFYKVRQQKILASDYGVPQSRRRLFIICDRDDRPKAIKKTEGIEVPRVDRILNMNGAYHYSPLVTEKRAKPTLERAQRAKDALGDETPFLLVYYGTDKGGGWQSTDIPLRTITTLDRFALVKPAESGDGHLMRMLQPAELQAAMGFPITFKLNRGTRREKIHMLGNAVCPPVMKAILHQLTGISQINAEHEGIK